MSKRFVVYVAGLAALWASGVVVADQREQVEKGTAHYLLFCGGCHGVEAEGQGKMAEDLSMNAPALTLLRQSGCAESVTERVLKAVDARHAVAVLGGEKMPAFSENLEIGTIIEISEYLKTIQQ